jgi:proteasome lid subunit RPN8/RPN11
VFAPADRRLPAMSCVSITDEVVLRGIARGGGGLLELMRATVEAPPMALENRHRRQAEREARELGLHGSERRAFIEERVTRLRANPWSSLLPARSASAPPRRIVLDRLRRPRVTVTLTPGARDALEQQIQAWAPYQVETGGFLFSHYGTDGGHVHVCHASGPAPDSLHRRWSVTIGRVADVRAEFPDFLARQDLLSVGSWHTHPDGDGEPSQPDRQAWASKLTRRFPSYLGVIATRDTNGFPLLRAWHCYRDEGRGVAVVEPANVA